MKIRAEIDRDIARWEALCAQCERRAFVCRIKLCCLWPLEAMGCRWAHKAAERVRDERDECYYAHEEFAMNAARAQERTLPGFDGTLEGALCDCGCRTWTDAMKALVAGAIAYDDEEKLAVRCAVVAEEDPATTRADGMPWTESVIVDLDWLSGSAAGCTGQSRDIHRRARADLVMCGIMADTAARSRSWLAASVQF